MGRIVARGGGGATSAASVEGGGQCGFEAGLTRRGSVSGGELYSLGEWFQRRERVQ